MRRGVIHDTLIVDYEPVHIMKAPPQSVMFPRSEKVDIQGVMNHIQENPDYFSDGIREIGANTNVGNGLSFSQPVYRNSYLKGSGQQAIAKEPYWNPAGGVRYNMDFLQIPEEYGDLLRLRRPDTTIEGVQQASIGLHIARPENIPTKVNALAITVMPSMVYENMQAPNPMDRTGIIRPSRNPEVMPSVVYENFQTPDSMDHSNIVRPSRGLTVMPNIIYDVGSNMPELADPSRMLVIKPASSMLGVSSDSYQTPDSAPNQLTKYVQPKDMINYLTPVFSTVVQMGDVSVPIHLKDPLEIVMQAQSQLPIDIPVPNVGSVRLKDYTWTIVQPNITAPAIFSIDITTTLKDKPDIAHMMEPLLHSAYKDVFHQEPKTLDYNRDPIGFETPLKSPYDNMSFDAPQWTHKVSKPYSSYDGASVIIPDNSQLLEFNVSMDRKPKIRPTPNETELIYTPWVNYA